MCAAIPACPADRHLAASAFLCKYVIVYRQHMMILAKVSVLYYQHNDRIVPEVAKACHKIFLSQHI